MKIFKNLETKFIKDTFWLYFSFIFFVSSGLLINLLILFTFGLSGLGIFIQIYTIYLVLSQISVFGVNDSAQRNLAFNIENKHEIVPLKIGALLNGLLIGIIFSLILYFFSVKIGDLVQSESVGYGLKLISPAIVFFTLNKIFLGILNGERRIKLYSISQSLRSLIMLLMIIFISIYYQDPYKLSYCFVGTEIILFTFSTFFFNFGKLSVLRIKRIIFWTKYHFKFGFKCFPIGFLTESYLKIDILMISLFLSDYKVGLYSFAAMFFEGVYQVPHLIRTNVNPVLVSLIKQKKRIKFNNFIKSLFLLSLLITSFFIIMIMLIYPFLNPYFPNNIINDSFPILVLLFIGLFFYSGFIPFDYVFLQAGMPLTQNFLLLLNIVINICLNTVFIPIYGLYGAAISTSLSLILAGINLTIFLYRYRLFPKYS